MKLYKSPVAIGIFLAIFLSGLLYHIKYRVVEIESALRKINNDIYKTEEGIHVLKAELAYYLTPASIQKFTSNLIQNDPYMKTTYLSQDDLDSLPDYTPTVITDEISDDSHKLKENNNDVR